MMLRAKMNMNSIEVEVKNVQYIITFIWSFFLVSMLTYVVSSIIGVPFDFMTAVILSLVFSVLVFVIAAIIPNESTPEPKEQA